MLLYLWSTQYLDYPGNCLGRQRDGAMTGSEWKMQNGRPSVSPVVSMTELTKTATATAVQPVPVRPSSPFRPSCMRPCCCCCCYCSFFRPRQLDCSFSAIGAWAVPRLMSGQVLADANENSLAPRAAAQYVMVSWCAVQMMGWPLASTQVRGISLLASLSLSPWPRTSTSSCMSRPVNPEAAKTLQSNPITPSRVVSFLP